MKPKRKARTVMQTAAAVALLMGAAAYAAPGPIVSDSQSRGKTLPGSKAHNFLAQSSLNADGTFTVGSANAPIKLTEYVSYTCPHCAEFHKESDPVLRLTAIPKGQVQVTVSSLLRNPVDLAVSLLVACGDPKQVWVRHNDFMATQDKWMAKTKDFSKDQEARWFTGPVPQRMRAIAGDFGFYQRMELWGVSRAQADQCLANQAVVDKMVGLQKKATAIGVPGTPSFTINGQLVNEHDWSDLSKDLVARISEHQDGMS